MSYLGGGRAKFIGYLLAFWFAIGDVARAGKILLSTRICKFARARTGSWGLIREVIIHYVFLGRMVVISSRWFTGCGCGRCGSQTNPKKVNFGLILVSNLVDLAVALGHWHFIDRILRAFSIIFWKKLHCCVMGCWSLMIFGMVGVSRTGASSGNTLGTGWSKTQTFNPRKSK